MQLASLRNGIAAHPHQAWLQWAAEMGFPSALLVSWLAARAALTRLLPVLRTQAGSRREPDVLRVCLTASVVAALTHAMVSGVLVMPYSQLWLSVAVGWLVGLQPAIAPSSAGRAAATSATMRRPMLFPWSVLLLASVMWLSLVVVHDYPRLQEREQAFASQVGGHFEPRFWLQGLIGTSERCATPASGRGCRTLP
jgi:hypothetical protein